jgi:hypothetical protein
MPFPSHFDHLFGFLWIQILLQANAQFFPQGLQLFQVLLVLATVLDLRLDTWYEESMVNEWPGTRASAMRPRFESYIPSKIRTAVGKSLTLLAAFSAAVRTEGAGTKSYAKALLRLRCWKQTTMHQLAICRTGISNWGGTKYMPYLKLEDVLHLFELLLISRCHGRKVSNCRSPLVGGSGRAGREYAQMHSGVGVGSN